MGQDPGLDAGIPDAINGTVTVQQDAVVQAEFPGATCTPTQDFAFPWNGVTVNFYANESAVVDPALLAALQAQGAPIVTP
ncbi:MAG: hypothetical protein JWO52_4050 [Gammaproteobacteria bacterium]|jgi:hypothetical protein|nr:hypothetical protein [Gammaproteobacteria bacterium]